MSVLKARADRRRSTVILPLRIEALEAVRGVVKELRQSLGKTNKEIDQLLAKKEALVE